MLHCIWSIDAFCILLYCSSSWYNYSTLLSEHSAIILRTVMRYCVTSWLQRYKLFVCVCVYVCNYVCVFVCMHAYMYACLYMYELRYTAK